MTGWEEERNEQEGGGGGRGEEGRLSINKCNNFIQKRFWHISRGRPIFGDYSIIIIVSSTDIHNLSMYVGIYVCVFFFFLLLFFFCFLQQKQVNSTRLMARMMPTCRVMLRSLCARELWHNWVVVA